MAGLFDTVVCELGVGGERRSTIRNRVMKLDRRAYKFTREATLPSRFETAHTPGLVVVYSRRRRSDSGRVCVYVCQRTVWGRAPSPARGVAATS